MKRRGSSDGLTSSSYLCLGWLMLVSLVCPIKLTFFFFPYFWIRIGVVLTLGLILVGVFSGGIMLSGLTRKLSSFILVLFYFLNSALTWTKPQKTSVEPTSIVYGLYSLPLLFCWLNVFTLLFTIILWQASLTCIGVPEGT